MAKAEAVIKVRLELENYHEILRLYHLLGDILIVTNPEQEGETGEKL